MVYGGNAMIYENGKLLAEAARFSLEPQIMMTQIDVEGSARNVGGIPLMSMRNET